MNGSDEWPLHGFSRGSVSSRAIGAVLMLILTGVAEAADPGSPITSDPIFNAVLVDGKETSGRIVSFESNAIAIMNNESWEVNSCRSTA